MSEVMVSVERLAAATAEIDRLRNRADDLAEEVARLRERQLPKVEDGCACHYHPGPVLGMPDDIEYEPACPEHSEHLYDPRSGSWIFRDPVKNAEWEAVRASEVTF